MAWSIKKITAKFNAFFKEKELAVTKDETNTKYQFEICFSEIGWIIYPYLTIHENNIISFNVNLSLATPKTCDFKKLNEFNQKSSYLKTYLHSSGIVTLEYRFMMCEDAEDILELLIQQLFLLQNEIVLL